MAALISLGILNLGLILAALMAAGPCSGRPQNAPRAWLPPGGAPDQG